MAVYHGKSGRVYMSTTGAGTASPVLSLNSWSADLSTDRVETTAFGDTNKTYVQGFQDSKISFEGFWNDADTTLFTAISSATGCKLYLYPSLNAASKYLYGPFWVDASINVGTGDAVKVSGSAAANGAFGVFL